MASVDYKTPTASLTTAATDGADFGLGFPPWDVGGISQVLLPVLCAIFITIVIIVIACCLIQKKSKSSGVLRQKSSHTIETLHEGSEHDIYDVIDEFRVKNLSHDKIQCRHGKLDYNCLLTSHRHICHSKVSNLFTSKSAAMCCQCAPKCDVQTSRAPVRNSRDWGPRLREAPPSDARLSTNTDGGASSIANDDDGIYETLDRHWTLKSELKVHHPIANCVDSSNQSGHKHGHAEVDSNINEMSETSSCQSSHSSQELQPSEDPCATYGDGRKLVCQISMFEISNEESKPALIETTYYQIQPQMSQTAGSNSACIPELLQKTNLRIVQDSTKETIPNTNLLLKPLKENEVLLHQLSQSLVRKNSQLIKTTKIYEKLHRTSSKRVPTLLVKKSESFRTASSELHAAKEKNRISRRKSDCSDMEAPQVNSRVAARLAHIPAGPEANRILTKLGPLPPVPGPRQDLNQVTEPKHNLGTGDKATSNSEESSAQNTALTVSPSSSFLSKKQSLSLDRNSEMDDKLASNENTNSLLCYPVVRVTTSNCEQKTAGIPESSQSREAKSTASETTDGRDLKSSELPWDIETQGECVDGASPGLNVCRVRVDVACDSSSLDPDDEVSNYYFELEPRAGALSNRNSDLGSGSDCDIGSNPNIDIQREAGHRSSGCSIEVKQQL
ncbi:hypothetical protein BsWGS_13762 [Bradybaena similaris]